MESQRDEDGRLSHDSIDVLRRRSVRGVEIPQVSPRPVFLFVPRNTVSIAPTTDPPSSSRRYVHDPNDETFELSRVDAVALDVVTQSRFTIHIYGYCGTSSLQEFANGDLKGLLPKLEPLEKLRYAAWVAQGVADVHGVGAEKETETEPSRGDIHREWVVPFIHNDLNMDNILLGKRDGVEVPLLNDFNIAVFRKKDAETGEPCKFRGRFANPQVSFLKLCLRLVCLFSGSCCSTFGLVVSHQ